MLQPHLGGELTFPRLLEVHAHIGREQRLEERGHERGVGKDSRRQVRQIIDRRAVPRQRGHLRAQADTESQQHDQRLHQRRQQRGVPFAQVYAPVTAEDGAALPGEGGNECGGGHRGWG